MRKQSYISTIINRFKTNLKFIQEVHQAEVIKENSRLWGAVKTYSAIKKTNAEINKYLYEPGKKLLVDINGNNIAESNKGKFFCRKEKTISNTPIQLYTPSEEEVCTANVLTIGGLDFTTERHLSALLKFADTLASMNNKGNKAWFKAVAVMPEVDKVERYEAAESYSMDSKFYPQYIEDRVKKFLIPKFIYIDNGKPNYDVPKSISLLSFSMGGREVMMMENALHDILVNEYSLSPSVVNLLMKKVKAVCIGYAPKLDIFKDYGFNKMVIFSIQDRAVLLPKDFHEKILTKVVDTNFAWLNMDSPSTKIVNRLVITEQKIIDDVVKQDSLNHTLRDYLQCIDSFPIECKEIIGNSLVCNDFNQSTNEEF